MANIKMLILALLLSYGSWGFAAQGPLDGRRYAIDFVAHKDDPPDRPVGSDTLVFTDGLGECVNAAKAYGYEKKPYQATKKKQVVSFSFTMESGKHGSLTFSGQMQGDHIQGQRIWAKPGKPNIVHNFTGKKQ